MDGSLKSLIAQVFDTSPRPFVVVTSSGDPMDGAIFYANPAFFGTASGLPIGCLGQIYSDALLGIGNVKTARDGGFTADVVLPGKRQARVEAILLPGPGSQPRPILLSHELCGADRDAENELGAAATLMNGLAAGVVIHREFCPLAFNPVGLEMLGLPISANRSDLPSTLLRHVPADSLEAVLAQHCAAVRGTSATKPSLVRLVSLGGQETWVELGAAAIDIGGAPAVVWTMSDANAHVEARAHEALLRDAVDNLNDSFILYDAEDRVVLTNKRFHQVFPYLDTQGEIVGKPMDELVRASVNSGAVTDPTLKGMDRDEWIAQFIDARRTHKIMLTEDTWPSGRWDLVKEQRLESGGFVSVRTDITDRKHAEFALKDQEARLEDELAERTMHLSAVLSNVAQGVLVLDPELRVVLTNEGFHDLLDCPRNLGTPGTHVRELIADRMKRGYKFLDELESDADPAILVERRVESYKPLSRERFRHILVGERTLEVTREKLSDGTTICTYTDITDRLRAEQEVERQREALHQSEKLSALGMLLAGVAHELNNPLQVVLGNAALLENDSITSDQANRAATIRDAAERCAKIIKTFLAMARNAPASRSAVDLNELVRRAFGLFGYQLRSRNIAVELDLSPSLEIVAGDPDQLSQVIVNLLLNAMQAIEGASGERTLRVKTRTVHVDRLIELEVSDTGPGVPAEIRGRIFDPFFTTKPVGVGTGIGLAVCHGMIAAHSGVITIDDAPGGGARFVVRLPWGSGDQNHADVAGRDDRAGLSGRVLVIDDEAEIRELLSDILELTGLQVDTAASGREALELIARGDYLAILCDLRMPDVDGPRLYGEVEQLAPAMLERFIFATGDLLNEATQAFLSEAGRPYLPKPFLPEQVRHVVTSMAAREK